MALPEVSIVTAITHERGLATDGNGRGEWFMPEDLKRFRAITTGHAVVIAARTFETILDAIHSPLPNRTNIVVGADLSLPGDCLKATNLQEGLGIAKAIDPQEVFVMGNQDFYQAAFPEVTKLYLTIIDGVYDTTERFPDYQNDFTLNHSSPGYSGGYHYNFQILTRKS